MPEENDPLEMVRRRLYANKPVGEHELDALRTKRRAAFTGWAPPPTLTGEPAPAEPGMPFALKFLIGGVAFFVLAGLAAAGILIFGGRTISTSNVNVLVEGPSTIASGDTVSLTVTVQNQNPVAISNAHLAVQFPDGTRSPDDPTQFQSQYAADLGDIPSGQTVSRTVRATVFGAQGQQLTFPVQVQYGTANSNANSTKQTSYALTVTTSPISVNVSSVSQAASGQPFTLTVEVRSNASTPLDNVALVGQYPPGFTFASAHPAPATGSFFTLGTLAPGAARTITIAGSLGGQEGDQRAFTFTAGTAADQGATLSLPYTSNQVIVTLAKPFLNVQLAVNNQTTDTVVVPAAGPVTGVLSWANTLGEPVQDAQIAVHFSGNAFDPTGVTSQTGYYDSNTGTLYFTKDTVPSLAALQAGETGGSAFTFTPRSGNIQNPTINMAITVSGQRASGGGTVSSTVNRTVLVGTSASVSSTLAHASAPFGDTGPAQPTVGQTSTYTVSLAASTPQNPVAGAVVSMQLPAYVTYTGKQQAGTGSIAYDDTTRTVTWTVGSITAGQTAHAAFQVSFLPSAPQHGTSPILVKAQTLTGTDRFTQAQVQATAAPLVSPQVH